MLVVYLAALETDAERVKMSEIYEELEPVMLRCAMLITKQKETAEDAVHNAFLAIIKHKDKAFSLSRREMRTYATVITKNKCIDLLRKQNKAAPESLDDIEYLFEASDMPVEDKIILDEDYNRLRKYIAALDETSRLVLEMKYYLGMSYKEIGDELGMSAKHVDTRITRAKDKVRKLVAKGGDPDER